MAHEAEYSTPVIFIIVALFVLVGTIIIFGALRLFDTPNKLINRPEIKLLPINNTVNESVINQTIVNVTNNNTVVKNVTSNNTIKKNDTKKSYALHWVTPTNATICVHGILQKNSYGNTICTRRMSGTELKNYTTWLENETQYNITNGLPNYLNITKPRYVYYRENCNNVTDPYTWNGIDWIVNSTHPLTCPEIRTWITNDMPNGGKE